MEDDEAWQECHNVEESHKSEEQRHVNSEIATNLLLQDCGIDRIHDCAGECKGITNGNLSLGFMREESPVFVCFPGEIDGGGKDNTSEGTQHPY